MDKTKVNKPEELGTHPSSSVSKEAFSEKTFRERTRRTGEWMWLRSLEQQRHADAQLAMV